MEKDLDVSNTVETYNFVELESLEKNDDGFYEWKERARWYKLEEDFEYGSERWSKPFVPSLPYRALRELKDFLENGEVLLDVEEDSLVGIADRVVEAAVRVNAVSDRAAPMLHATILARHHHHHQKEGLTSKVVTPSLDKPALSDDHSEVFIVIQKSKASGLNLAPEGSHQRFQQTPTNPLESPIALLTEDCDSINRNCKSSLHDRIVSGGGETTTILVAKLPFAKHPVALFVRLKESSVLGNLTETRLPVRFICLIMGPANGEHDLYQVGRAVGALMSDLNYSNTAAHALGKEDILSGIESFLSVSVMIPCGKWDRSQIHSSICRLSSENSSKLRVDRRSAAHITDSVINHFQRTGVDQSENELVKSGKLFAGLVGDVERKLSVYPSDFTDAAQFRCVIVIVFMYFSFLVPAMTFGVLLSNNTGDTMGVSQSIEATAISGVVFGFFAGQPLIVLGATGPMLVMEGSIYQLSVMIGADFLSWRVWIGVWITLFCLAIVALDLTSLVRYFTPFTEEVLAALVSTIFIYESVKFLSIAFLEDQASNSHSSSSLPNASTSANGTFDDICRSTVRPSGRKSLLTLILTTSTFFISVYSQKVKNSKYFPLNLRMLFSDSGILLAIVIVYCFNLLVMQDYMPTLEVPDGFLAGTSTSVGWFANIRRDVKAKFWLIIFAAVPAFLVVIILFMETLVTGIVMSNKGSRLKKGTGCNLDIIVIGVLFTLMSLLGLPWMCACPVHSIFHLNSLSVLSTNHAPGTKPFITHVIEQRVTNIVMHLMIGATVLLAPMLRGIPVAIMFGVFLYLGVMSLAHLQLVQRTKLLLIPANYHPDLSYVRKVKTSRIHLYTLIQLGCLAIVVAVKSTILAPCFPFFVLLMIPLRSVGLKRIFKEDELEVLDNRYESHGINESLDECEDVPM